MLKELVRNNSSLPFDGFGHRRCRGHADRASGALETNIYDRIAFADQPNLQSIAAERIMAIRRTSRFLELLEISRMAPMVQYELLVEFAQFRH